MKKLLFLLLIMLLSKIATAQHNSDDIIGHWMNTENNLEVEVFKVNMNIKLGLYGLMIVMIKASL